MWRVPEIWKGGDCFILGGGPSLTEIFNIPKELVRSVTDGIIPLKEYSPFLSPIHGKHVIGINGAYKLGLWVNICFFGDNEWYRYNRIPLSQWPNLKVSCAPMFSVRKGPELEGVKYLAKIDPYKGLSKDPSKILWGKHSGSGAINLAYLLGAKRIYLIGFDMKSNTEKRSHWHKEYGTAYKVPPYRRHLEIYPHIAVSAKKLGVEIINLNPNSAIQVFPFGRPPWLD